MKKFKIGLFFYLLIIAFASPISTRAYDTEGYESVAVGVNVSPYNFNQNHLVEIKWKSTILEYQSNTYGLESGGNKSTTIPGRIEFNSVKLQGSEGVSNIGAMIQNLIHEFDNGACETAKIIGGLEMYFTVMDSSSLGRNDGKSIANNLVGLKLKANPDVFPKFRKMFVNIDSLGIVGNNIYNTESLGVPSEKSPITIEWNIKRGNLIKNPSGNLAKNINCNNESLASGNYYEWNVSATVKQNNKTKFYDIATYYLPSIYAEYLHPNQPLTFHQEQFGACKDSLSANKTNVLYDNIEVRSNEKISSKKPSTLASLMSLFRSIVTPNRMSEWIKIKDWKLNFSYDGNCGSLGKDNRYGVGVVKIDKKNYLTVRTGHEEDKKLKRSSFIFYDVSNQDSSGSSSSSSSSSVQSYGVAETRPYFESDKEANDIIGVKYKFKIASNEGQNMKILFGGSRLSGASADTYYLERNIYNSKVSYFDPVCSGGWEKLNNMTIGQSTLRIAVPDYIKKGKTGLKTDNSSYFPRINYGIDNVADVPKTDVISQANLNGQEGTIETLRGNITNDKSGWKCDGKVLDGDTYRQWNIKTTIGNSTYQTSIALPENGAKYLTPYELINFRTEFFQNAGLFKIYLWDFQFKRESKTSWEPLTKWKVSDYDGNTANYGIRKTIYNGNNAIEISNDNSVRFLAEGEKFEMSQSSPSSSSSSSSSIATAPTSPVFNNKYSAQNDKKTNSDILSWSWVPGTDGGPVEKYYIYPSWLSSGFYTTDTSYASQKLSDGYYWINIAAINSLGWSDYAGDDVRIVTKVPATPVFTTTYNGKIIGNRTPTWTWKAGNDGGAVEKYWVFPSWLPSGFFTSGTSYTSSESLPNGFYWINMSAKNSAGWSSMTGDNVNIKSDN